MKKPEFSRLFRRALNEALESAMHDGSLDPNLPFQIKLYGAKHGGDIMNVEQAVDDLYISENLSYFIIDVAAILPAETPAVFFVRASDHPPVPFDKTYNGLSGGPFKNIGPMKTSSQV